MWREPHTASTKSLINWNKASFDNKSGHLACRRVSGRSYVLVEVPLFRALWICGVYVVVFLFAFLLSSSDCWSTCLVFILGFRIGFRRARAGLLRAAVDRHGRDGAAPGNTLSRSLLVNVQGFAPGIQSVQRVPSARWLGFGWLKREIFRHLA